MNKAIILLCFVILVKPVVPVFEYIFNYNYIATELCINKDNVILGCDGKCYLVKQLAKASDVEKPLSSDKKHVVAETTDLFIAEFHVYDFFRCEALNSKRRFFKTSDLKAQLYAYSHFHPPILVS